MERCYPIFVPTPVMVPTYVNQFPLPTSPGPPLFMLPQPQSVYHNGNSNHPQNALHQAQAHSGGLPQHLLTQGNERSPVCRHFCEGRCERGAACNFSHDLSKGLPLPKKRLLDVIRLVSVAALETKLDGKDVVNEILTEECAGRYVAKIVAAPCFPHPRGINQRIKMCELHFQEKRGYSVKKCVPNKTLDEVLQRWDHALQGNMFCLLPKNPHHVHQEESAKVENESSYLIGRCPSYGSMRVSLLAWAQMITPTRAEPFLELFRRELQRVKYFERLASRDAEERFEAFMEVATSVLNQQMHPVRYLESLPQTARAETRSSCYHPDSFIEQVRLAFPNLIFCRSYTVVNLVEGKEIKLIVAGKQRQIEAFFDKISEFLWVVENITCEASVRGIRPESEEMFRTKVYQHWKVSPSTIDDMPPTWRQRMENYHRQIVFQLFRATAIPLIEERELVGVRGTRPAIRPPLGQPRTSPDLNSQSSSDEPRRSLAVDHPLRKHPSGPSHDNLPAAVSGMAVGGAVSHKEKERKYHHFGSHGRHHNSTNNASGGRPTLWDEWHSADAKRGTGGSSHNSSTTADINSSNVDSNTNTNVDTCRRQARGENAQQSSCTATFGHNTSGSNNSGSNNSDSDFAGDKRVAAVLQRLSCGNDVEWRKQKELLQMIESDE